jgi:hypothetical protein
VSEAFPLQKLEEAFGHRPCHWARTNGACNGSILAGPAALFGRNDSSLWPWAFAATRAQARRQSAYKSTGSSNIRQVLQGRQPLGLITNWIFRHPRPLDWAEQCALIARL